MQVSSCITHCLAAVNPAAVYWDYNVDRCSLLRQLWDCSHSDSHVHMATTSNTLAQNTPTGPGRLGFHHHHPRLKYMGFAFRAKGPGSQAAIGSVLQEWLPQSKYHKQLQLYSLSLSLSLSLHFNSHFPGEPGLAGVYWSKGWWRWCDNWTTGAISQVMQSSSQIITINKPTSSFFNRPDALPVAQPTVSKEWRENITFHGLAYPKLTWGLPTLSLTTNSFWLPWGRVAMPLISPLMPVPHATMYTVREKAALFLFSH